MFNEIFMTQFMLKRPKLPEAIQQLLIDNPAGLTRNQLFHGVNMDISSDQLTNALNALMAENIVLRTSQRSSQKQGEKPVCLYVAVQHTLQLPRPTLKGRPRQERAPSPI